MTPILSRKDNTPPIISLNAHNVLDYAIGVVLVFSPYIFGFSDIYSARNAYLVSGFGLIAYSLITNYRYSIFKVLPLGVHMALDVIVGIALILSPSIFYYAPLLTSFQYAWHFVCGIGAIGLVILTRPRTSAQMFSDEMDRRLDIDRAA